jgi:chloramphenicol-sensitive protein RarD
MPPKSLIHKPIVDPRGVLLSVIACTLFALMPAYVQLLKPVSGYAIAGQRIIWSSILLFIFFAGTRQLKTAINPLLQIRSWPGLLLGSLLIGAQWWIFVWAPVNGHTLDVSLGYFLLPIVMVLIGKFWFKEKLRPLQWLAAALAVAGITFMLIQAGGVSWVALVICLGYPQYFILRRIQSLPTTSIFFIENILLLPLAIWAVLHFGSVPHPFAFTTQQLLGFAGLGLLGSVPMLCFIAASRRLPISIFGLLNYLEPVLIFVVGYLFLHEQLPPNEYTAYLIIMAALLTLAVDGLIKSGMIKRT